jgi:hypothetical protein
MSNISDIIQSAIITGSTISIVYNGGSRPGQSRELIPLSLTDENLVARDPSSRRGKTFKIHKIASASLGSGEEATNPEVSPTPPEKKNLVPEFTTFEECAAHLKEILKSSDFNLLEDENYFAVAGFFKNGKPRKTPTASLQFIDRSVETVFNIETGEFEEQKRELTGRERPWRVDSISMKEGKSFAQIHKAAELFLQEVNSNSSLQKNA